ncbi:hypothetical protein [Desulfoluna sp.]|uniref:hypothetical protein n=1 Tax=Desulfoluna sp. TaxID=2045199 RepID=UPI00260B1D4F|nr:hypothetical protein [Desulfoluna sp.]
MAKAGGASEVTKKGVSTMKRLKSMKAATPLKALFFVTIQRMPPAALPGAKLLKSWMCSIMAILG